MKDELYKKHLEAIEEETLDSYKTANSIDVVVCYKNDLATKCTSITEKYGEIKRLEGMIAMIKEGSIDQANRLRLYGLEKQLEQLKKSLTPK